MGTWGTGIFDNDLSEDVKISYIELLREGYEGDEATQKVMGEYGDVLTAEPSDWESIEDFWLGLAAVQWTYGRLTDDVKERACEILVNSPTYFEDPLENRKREKVKKQWLERLQGPMPAPKKIKVFKPFVCPWKVGDIFAFPISPENCQKEGVKSGYIVFQKVGVGQAYPRLTIPVVHVAKKIFCECPTVEEYLESSLLPQFWAPQRYEKWWDGD